MKDKREGFIVSQLSSFILLLLPQTSHSILDNCQRCWKDEYLYNLNRHLKLPLLLVIITTFSYD